MKMVPKHTIFIRKIISFFLSFICVDFCVCRANNDNNNKKNPTKNSMISHLPSKNIKNSTEFYVADFSINSFSFVEFSFCFSFLLSPFTFWF